MLVFFIKHRKEPWQAFKYCRICTAGVKWRLCIFSMSCVLEIVVSLNVLVLFHFCKCLTVFFIFALWKSVVMAFLYVLYKWKQHITRYKKIGVQDTKYIFNWPDAVTGSWFLQTYIRKHIFLRTLTGNKDSVTYNQPYGKYI